MDNKIIIIGAGPTGLGAAYRLNELGYKNWKIVERTSYIGGLSASFKDKEGFTWDVGGHVIFSHYEKFDRMVEEALGGKYLEHLRESWIRILDRWVPYPFQNNLRYLPKEILHECLVGLLHVSRDGHTKPANFQDWILCTFGEGIAKHFMLPYNTKVWSTPLEDMSKHWIAERVSVVDFERVLKNAILEKDDISWGPNNKFQFPLNGGTGEIFNRIATKFEEHLHCGNELLWIDTKTRSIGYTDGSSDTYDTLITTLPIDQLITKIKNKPDQTAAAGMKLVANSVMIVGIGFDRPDQSRKNWMYFPEKKCPCYRVTYFSNYSHNNVPDINKNFSLMGEVSYPRGKRLSEEAAVEETIQGFINTGLISESDRHHIKSIFTMDLDYAYPVPTLDRDQALSVMQPYLEAQNIYSRGRFGAWRYEIGNMDHSVMQGIEIVDRLLSGKEETVFSK
jgi:protoporphyrinogen oxidase